MKLNTNDSLLNNVTENKIDPIMTIMEKFSKCQNPDKINLTVGAYKDEDLKSYVFNVVRKVEETILKDGKNREYLPPTGDPEFCVECRKLVFDENSDAVKDNRVVSCQGISGTGSIRILAQYLGKFMGLKNKLVLIPNPTWSNHNLIFKESGFEEKLYNYFDKENLDVDYESIKNALIEAPDESVVLLHTCAHNPTGCDLTQDQWVEISFIIKEKKHFTILDTAYQGFATGNIKQDIFPVYLFTKVNVEFGVCQSFSKNLGLYGERAGAMHLVFKNQGSKEENNKLHERIKYGLAQTALSLYLIPVGYGSEIIKRVLKNHKSEWETELKLVVGRLIEMRELLYQELIKINCPGNWDHIKKQKGMFAYTGLNEKQCDYLIEEKNLFLVRSGRISICGINKKNVSKVAQYIKEAMELN